MSVPRVATYRLQFRNGMTFDRAVEIVPYLSRLGISHLYASPIFTAVTGSTHGYDVTDCNEIDPAIGGREGFERLHAALRAAGMGLVLDIVPNHMAASLENRWWHSVIEEGEGSPFARHFDIDWNRPLTLPVLGASFGEVLEAGDLALVMGQERSAVALAYFDNRFPLARESHALVAYELSAAAATLGLPASRQGASSNGPDLEAGLARLSADKSFMNRLHEAQHYRLTHWKSAREDLSYRRFFEVTGLVGLRVEDDAVFDDSHRLILELVKSGMVDGLRVDHVDGLADPGGYLDRLRAEAGPDVWLLVEKILGKQERLPETWPIAGSTGYEFITALSNLLGNEAGRQELEGAYRSFCDEEEPREVLIRRAKELILRRNFAGELRRVAEIGSEIVEAEGGSGFSGSEFEDAVAELLIGLDVYRLYGIEGPLDRADTDRLNAAMGMAREGGKVDPSALQSVRGLLEGCADGDRERLREFRARFQQLSGPVAAKSIEDTFFYRFNPAIGLNEVGALPEEIPLYPSHFHAAMRVGLEHRQGLLATSTHDTKRGEDARARLYALTERASQWSQSVLRWHRMNEAFLGRTQERLVPEPAVEWMIYQMLLGAWPCEASQEHLDDLCARLVPAVEKSLREAKLETDWIDIDDSYEEAVLNFTRKLFAPETAEFRADFAATVAPFIEAGRANGLLQTLAKLTAPGVPDIYQGSELEDLSLVDPDNRRSIDFDHLAARLAAAGAGDWDKQCLIAACLKLRRQHPVLFEKGGYEPVAVESEGVDHVVSYLREHEDQALLVVMKRFSLLGEAQTAAGTARLRLPGRLIGWNVRNVLDGSRFEAGQTLSAAQLLGEECIALCLLERQG
jgi:(1->4)-alpha-D-glucan 1-alpha-D-glucosylmutase